MSYFLEKILYYECGLGVGSHVNAHTGRRPKYLLSGLLTCGICGRKFIVITPDGVWLF